MSEWRKSTLWRRAMKGFPAGWVTIMRDDRGLFSWEVLLVDVSEPKTGIISLGNFAYAKRVALAEYEAMSRDLERARGLA